MRLGPLLIQPGFDSSWFEHAELSWNSYLDHTLGQPRYLFFQPEG